MGNYQAAISAYTDAIETKNDEPAFYTNRAIAFIKLENFAKAQEDCKAALRVNPKFAKAYNRLSKCYIALGDLQERLQIGVRKRAISCSTWRARALRSYAKRRRSSGAPAAVGGHFC